MRRDKLTKIIPMMPMEEMRMGNPIVNLDLEFNSLEFLAWTVEFVFQNTLNYDLGTGGNFDYLLDFLSWSRVSESSSLRLFLQNPKFLLISFLVQGIH